MKCKEVVRIAREPYTKYGDCDPEPLTPQFTKSSSGAVSSAEWQATVARFLKGLQRGWAPLEAYYTLQPTLKFSLHLVMPGRPFKLQIKRRGDRG